MKTLKRLGVVGGVVVICFGIYALYAWAVQALWNWIVPIFWTSAPILTYWEAVGVTLLLTLISGCFRMTIKE